MMRHSKSLGSDIAYRDIQCIPVLLILIDLHVSTKRITLSLRDRYFASRNHERQDEAGGITPPSRT